MFAIKKVVNFIHVAIWQHTLKIKYNHAYKNAYNHTNNGHYGLAFLANSEFLRFEM
jgi:hypothetical protein